MNDSGVAVAVAIGRSVRIGVARTGMLLERADVIAAKPIVPTMAITINQPICEGEAVELDLRRAMLLALREFDRLLGGIRLYDTAEYMPRQSSDGRSSYDRCTAKCYCAAVQQLYEL